MNEKTYNVGEVSLSDKNLTMLNRFYQKINSSEEIVLLKNKEYYLHLDFLFKFPQLFKIVPENDMTLKELVYIISLAYNLIYATRSDVIYGYYLEQLILKQITVTGYTIKVTVSS